MRNLPTLLAATVVVLILGFYMCTFQVRFTEVAILKTFGEKSGDTLDDPGLYAKWPWPIQSVVKFDTRIRVLEDRTEETITADSKNVIVTTTTFWTVEDPYLFHKRFERDQDGEKQLRNAIRSRKKAVIGQYDFSNFVSTNPQDRKLREAEQNMLEPVREVWRDEYGVNVKYFGITKLTLPESATKAIFGSMKKAQQNKAQNYEAEGNAQAAQIIASARATEQRIMAVAQRKADEIRNEGQKKVSEIYSQFQEHPELRIFLDKLAALQSLRESTVILTRENTPVDLFSLDDGATLSDLDFNLTADPKPVSRK